MLRLQASGDTQPTLQGKELYLTVNVGAQDPKGGTYDGSHVGVRTRTLHSSASTNELAANETFLLELPERMAGAPPVALPPPPPVRYLLQS